MITEKVDLVPAKKVPIEVYFTQAELMSVKNVMGYPDRSVNVNTITAEASRPDSHPTIKPRNPQGTKQE